MTTGLSVHGGRLSEVHSILTLPATWLLAVPVCSGLVLCIPDLTARLQELCG